MRIGNNGETGSVVRTDGATVRPGEMPRASSAGLLPEASLRRTVDSDEDDVFACWFSDLSSLSTNAAGRKCPPSSDDSSRLQHLDRNVREAAAILYAVIILGMIIAVFLVALLLR